MHISSIPDSVSKYFWGDNLSELSVEKNANYIIQTILNLGDQKAVKWLFSTFGEEMIKEKLSDLKLTPLSENFWNLYLS